MPKALALSADWMAISASCSAVGFGFTAQSPYTTVWPSSSMKNTLETMLAFGAVLMSCKAGRMVFAVVCTAPETKPSTSFCVIIIVPSTTVSFSCSRACSSVIPLDLRSSHIGATYCSAMVSGSMISRLSGNVMFSDSATACTAAGLASSTQRAMPFSWQMAAARTVRGSEPSGSTMRLLASRAFCIILKRNWAGDTRSVSPAAGFKPDTCAAEPK